MAVYEHKYKPYEGQLTSEPWRFLVIPRHAYRDLFQSKLVVGIFAASIIASLVGAILIYVPHNASVLTIFQVQAGDLLTITSNFFRIYLTVQHALGFLLTVLVGPILISRDLSNNALPLYLSRPFSRPEYLLGKAAVLIILLSLMTWVPGLLLFVFQSYLVGWEWFSDNYWVATAIFLSSAIWIATLTLSSLALSAWIKWRLAASGALFSLYTVPMAIASIISELFRTPWSHLFNPSMLIKVVMDDLFDYAIINDLDDAFRILPVWGGWVGLIGFSLFFLWLLSRKVRAYEVVV